MPNNANKRAREANSGSKTPDELHSDMITLKSIIEKLECIQDLVSRFELCISHE